MIKILSEKKLQAFLQKLLSKIVTTKKKQPLGNIQKRRGLFLSVYGTDISLIEPPKIGKAESFLSAVCIDKENFLNATNDTEILLSFFLCIVNRSAYHNSKNPGWCDDNHNSFDSILKLYKNLAESENKTIANNLMKIFSSLEKEIEESKEIKTADFLSTALKEYKDSITKKGIRESCKGLIDALAITNFSNNNDRLTDLKRQIQNEMDYRIWPYEYVSHLFRKLSNYYNQINTYQGYSEKLKETKKQTWRLIFGPKLYFYLNLMTLRRQSKLKNILILGETGTGKETIARAIGGKDVPSINIAAIEQKNIEAELFGVRKDSYTGVKDRLGIFLHASGYGFDEKGELEWKNKSGDHVLFMDEIGEISKDIQVKLLRVIEEQKVRRLGEEKDYPISLKIVTATNQPIYQMIERKLFRRDLFERIVNGGVIKTYPLCDRKEVDILPIVKEYIDNNYPQTGINTSTFQGDLNKIKDYTWPGNIRELHRAVDYHFRKDFDSFMEMIAEQKAAKDPFIEDFFIKSRSIKEMTLWYCQYIVEKCNGNKSKASKILGISLPTVYSHLKEIKEKNDK